MRPGMIAIIADGERHSPRASWNVGAAMQRFGLPFVRHVVSVSATPGYVLQLVAQLDATFARLIIVAGRRRATARCAACSTWPRRIPAGRRPRRRSRRVALQAAKAFALDDTVVFGRVLLTQANMCSAVMQADGAERCPRPPKAAWYDGVTAPARATPVGALDDGALKGRCRRIALTVDEVRRIAHTLGRDPTLVELYAFDAQWSEHCSYKVEPPLLRRLPVEGPTVMQGPAEDAGVLHLGEWNGTRYGVVIAHESHNHPSQVVPFEGAATGVGGIVRDVLCMGATVIALADGLRFGRLENAHCRYVAQSVVDGIAAYGNAIGVPTIAGDVYVDEGFDDNVLVNVVALGLVKEGEIVHSRAPEGAAGWDIVLIGKATDRSGFGGASFSSLTLDAADAERIAVRCKSPIRSSRTSSCARLTACSRRCAQPASPRGSRTLARAASSAAPPRSSRAAASAR